MTSRVLVVGGGLAGLLAARRHLRAGHRVVLLEATGAVGGAIAQATLPDAGDLALNTGAEAYSTGSGAVDALVAELGLAEQIVAPREGLGSRVVSGAGAHRAPGASLLGSPPRARWQRMCGRCWAPRGRCVRPSSGSCPPPTGPGPGRPSPMWCAGAWAGRCSSAWSHR
ncbi:FAD-dependent oxidoreductase [Brachybacterium sp. Z12]|uniref:FAD-dependent oxidoreductase n=1 Tax=Brachybacterium sp. Z12 TaxID=2759167 RepID=UPI00223C0CFB|nr:FAD-dependent oxidoreductase [Brachybacterium sp. Z12]